MLMYQLSCSSVSTPATAPPSRSVGDILIDQRSLEHPLEWPNRHARIRNSPVAVCVEVELSSTACRRDRMIRRVNEPSFRVDIKNPLRYRGAARDCGALLRIRLDHVKPAHFPILGQIVRPPSVGHALAGEFSAFTTASIGCSPRKLVIEVLDFRGEAKKRIRIEIARVSFPPAATATRAVSSKPNTPRVRSPTRAAYGACADSSSSCCPRFSDRDCGSG